MSSLFKPVVIPTEVENALGKLGTVNWSTTNTVEELREKIGYATDDFYKFAKSADLSGDVMQQYKKHINPLPSAIGKITTSLKAFATSTAIMLALSVVIKAVSAAWDKFNTTVVEAEEDLKETQSTITSLKEQIKELESLDANSLTQGQKDKLENLKEQLEVQKQLEQIEKRRLARETIGNGNFADYFDKDSYKNASFKIKNDLIDYQDSIVGIDKLYEQRSSKVKNLSTLVSEGKKAKTDVTTLEKRLENAEKKQQKTQEDILELQGDLISSKADIQGWITKIQGYIDDGSLVGSDYDKAKQELEELEGLLQFVNNELNRTNTLLYGGDDSWENVLLEKTQYSLKNLRGYGFTDDELEFLSTLTFDKDATLEELKEILEEAQKEANKNPLEPKVKFSKSQMIDTINDMSDGFDILDNIYADIYDKGKFDFTNLDSSKFEEAFKGLGTEYTEFIETVSESPNDISACQEAFDKLATAFIESKGILENLTEENANVAAAMLKNMGIANAEEIVMAQLAYNTEMASIEKQCLAKYSVDLANATYEEIVQLVQEHEYSELAEIALHQLALAKLDVNKNKIDTSTDIANIINLAKAAASSEAALQKLKNAKAVMESYENGGLKTGAISMLDVREAQKVIDSINNKTFDYGFEMTDPSDFKITDYDLYKPVYEGAEKTASAVAESAKDAYGDMFDFFERRVKVLEDAFGNLEAGIENVLGADAKNTLLSAQLGILDEEVNNYTDALAMYKEQANNVLSTISDPALREKIVNGSVSLVDLQGENNEQVKAALEAYQGWADKIAECTQKLEQLKTQIRQLELQKFNNIIEDFTDQFDIRGTAIDNIDKQIGLLEESGELVGKGYYEQQIIQAKGQLNILERQKSEMVKSLADAINSGRIQKGTEEWQEMVTAIQQIDGQIIECKTDVEKFSNSIQEIDWNNFNRLQDIFSGIHDELGNLAGLFDDTNDIAVSDGKGNWTNEALTTMGLYAQQYESAKYQVEQYADEIAELEADYAAGNISATEYIDKLSELKQGQWSAVESMEAAEDALISLNEKRIQESIEAINKEIEAYNDLINAKLEALDAEKDLHDYRQSIAEKSKSITDIEKQLAAMANDDSLAARAKKAQLQEQLSEAQKDLEETEYNHSIEAQRDALSKQAEDYEKARQKDIEKLEESLKNRELLLIQSFNTVKDNATIIGQQILAIAQQHGINVDSVITTAWANGSNAIAGYGQALTTQSSSFITNLAGVETKVLSLQNQADTTSYSIANMFGQQANNLIGQLSASWASESNLNTMTGILQNSLINTLERGYNISGATSALSGIESGANNVASAANNAAAALRRLLEQQQSTNTYRVLDNRYGRIIADGFSSPQEAQAWLNEHAPNTKQHYTIAKAFAKGSKRIDKDQLAWTDEHGNKEMIIRRSDGAILTRLEKNDAIANANLAENLFKWGEIAPSSFMQKLLGANSYNVNVPVKSSQPSIVLDYDLNIGNFTDGEHLLNTIQKVSKESATKLLNDINRDFRIRGR